MNAISLEHLPIAAQIVGLALSVLAVGWAGFRWLRERIREEFGGDAFRQAVRAESIEALKDEAGQRAMDAVVARALTGIADGQNKAIQSIELRLAKQGERIGEAEQKIAKLEGRFGEELARLHRLLSRLYKALRAAGLIKPVTKTEEPAS